jgi:restriction system protein
MRSAWQVRAGRGGEREQEAIDAGLVIVGWESVPDLAGPLTREDFRLQLLARYPGRSIHTVGNWTGQLWRFVHEMAEGDLVVMPLKTQRLFAIGVLGGPYRYRAEAAPGFRHVRSVRWSRTDVEREELGMDLRSNLRSMLTVCRLSRSNAVERIREVSQGRPDPG